MKKATKFNFMEIVALLILFLFAISFLDMAGYIFAGMILMMLIFEHSDFRIISYRDLWLFLFSISYFVFSVVNFGLSTNSIVLYLMGPWAAYFIGKQYIKFSSQKKAFLIFISVLSLGFWLHGVLNLVAYVNSEHFKFYQYYRQSVDFWRGELVKVTGTGMFYSFATGISTGVLFTSFNKKYKFLAVVILSISLFATAFFANRTLIFIIAIIFAYKAWTSFFREDLQINIYKLVLVTFLCVLIMFISIVFIMTDSSSGVNLFDIKIIDRLVNDNSGSRIDIWSYFIKDFAFLKHPFGGGILLENTEHSYFHNFWLDVYNSAGIIPFICIVIVSVFLIRDYLRYRSVLKDFGKNNELIVFECLIFAAVLNFGVEPILEANPYCFLILLMIFGAMEGYVQKVTSESYKL